MDFFELRGDIEWYRYLGFYRENEKKIAMAKEKCERIRSENSSEHETNEGKKDQSSAA